MDGGRTYGTAKMVVLPPGTTVVPLRTDPVEEAYTTPLVTKPGIWYKVNWRWWAREAIYLLLALAIGLWVGLLIF